MRVTKSCLQTLITEQTSNPYFLEKDAPVSGVVYCDHSVVPGSTFINFMWVQPVPEWKAEAYHSHDVGKLLFFSAGNNPKAGKNDVKDNVMLDGKVEVVIVDEKHTITTTSYVFIPANTPHAITYRDLTKPILQVQYLGAGKYTSTSVDPPSGIKVVGGFGSTYTRDDSAYGKNICDTVRLTDPDFNDARIATNYVFPKNVPGVFYSDATIILANKATTHADKEGKNDGLGDYATGFTERHWHHAGHEYFLFIGLDAGNPKELGAKLYFVANDKTLVSDLTDSAIIYVPTGTPHTPVLYRTIDDPTLIILFGSTNLATWDIHWEGK